MEMRKDARKGARGKRKYEEIRKDKDGERIHEEKAIDSSGGLHSLENPVDITM